MSDVPIRILRKANPGRYCEILANPQRRSGTSRVYVVAGDLSGTTIDWQTSLDGVEVASGTLLIADCFEDPPLAAGGAAPFDFNAVFGLPATAFPEGATTYLLRITYTFTGDVGPQDDYFEVTTKDVPTP